MAILNFSFDTFGYRYAYEVADDLSDQEATIFAGILRRSIQKFLENQTDIFPMFFDVSKLLEAYGNSGLIGRINRLTTFCYFSKWE